MKRLFYLIILLILTQVSLSADVKGNDGVINFDVDSQGAKEAILNSTGLGLGTAPSSNLHVIGNVIVSQNLSIGTTDAQSNLNLAGTLGFSTQLFTSDGNIESNSFNLVNTSSGNVTLTLPDVSSHSGKIFTIKLVNASNSCFIDGNGSTIDGESIIKLAGSQTSDLSSVQVISNGSSWFILEETNYQTFVASSNLVAWWKLDEADGSATAEDSWNNGYHATNNGFSAGNIGVTGKVGTAYDFDRADGDNYVNAGVIDLAGWNGVSLAAWVYYRGGGSDEHTVIGTWDVTNTKASAQLKIDPADSNGLEGQIIGEDGFALLRPGAAFTISTNVWTHVALTYGADDVLRIYKDGVAYGTTTASQGNLSSVSTTHSFRIGGDDAFSNDDFDGLIDDCRLYNKQLSSAELQAIVNEAN